MLFCSILCYFILCYCILCYFIVCYSILYYSILFYCLGNVTFRKSFGGSCSPEQPWLAPETFACLETFGPANKEDLPYEIFGLGANESGFDRVGYIELSPFSHEKLFENFGFFFYSLTATFGNFL